MTTLAYIAAMGLLTLDGIVSSRWIHQITTAVISRGVPVNMGAKVWSLIVCFGIVSGMLSGLCFIWLAKPRPVFHAVVYSAGVLFVSLSLAIVTSRLFDSGIVRQGCHRPGYTAPVMVGWSAPVAVGRCAPPMVARCEPPAVG